MSDPELNRCRKMTVGATALSLAAMFVVPHMAGFALDAASFWPLYLIILIFAAFIPYTVWRDMRRLRSALEASCLGFLMTLPVLIFSYAAMRVGMPLADDTLAAADRAIGFDWRAFVEWVDGLPILARSLAVAYSSFAWQLILLPVALALLGFERRAYEVALGYLILCTAAICVSVPFPSVGAYEGYGYDGHSLSHVNAHFGYFFLKSFNAVRSDPAFALSLQSAAGIITFPSIHAGVALLCAWAAWPSRLLRLPFLALNLLMALSAISHGAHYLVDVLAGLIVAALSIMTVRKLTASSRYQPSFTTLTAAA